MTGIYLILIFIIPGLLIKGCKENFYISERREPPKGTIYENLLGVIVRSTFSSILAISILFYGMKIYGIQIELKIDVMLRLFNEIRIFLIYILCMAIATMIVGLCEKLFITPLFYKIKKKISRKKSGVIEIPSGATVWEDIFFNKEKVESSLVASIYKDGKYITAGIIQGWNAGYLPKREFEILRTKEVEQVLEDDKERKNQDKWLKYISYEYFDLDTGILIKFYESEKMIEHWDKISYK